MTYDHHDADQVLGRTMGDVMRYVLGFAFSSTHSDVLLVAKNRPAWQAGKLNGVGGKIENNESDLAAMHREFREETNLKGFRWRKVVRMFGPGWEVVVFMATGDIHMHGNPTDELIRVYPSTMLGEISRSGQAIPNLAWLIPLCLDRDFDYNLHT